MPPLDTPLNAANLVQITPERHAALLRAEKELDALHAWGVDNWEGYGDALRDMEDNGEAVGP